MRAGSGAGRRVNSKLGLAEAYFDLSSTSTSIDYASELYELLVLFFYRLYIL